MNLPVLFPSVDSFNLRSLKNKRAQNAHFCAPGKTLICCKRLIDWGLTSHQHLRSYGDGTSVYSPIRRTGEARDRTCDPWFTRRVTLPLHHGGL